MKADLHDSQSRLFRCRILFMMDEKEQDEINHTTETAESVGQVILGGIEKIGGILTADPITQAEGEYNISAGTLHGESNKALKELDEDN